MGGKFGVINPSNKLWNKNRFLLAVGVFVLCAASSIALNDSKDLVLTLAEKNALDKLKAQVIDSLPENFMKTDFYLIRWLRVAKLDVSRARTLVLQNVKWRLQNNITNTLKEDFSDLEQDYTMSFGGLDKEGRPIYGINFGDWDIRAGVLQGKTQRLQRYLTYSNERMMQRVFEEQEKGNPVTRFVVILDAENLNFRQHLCPSCMPVLIHWATVGEANYPLFSDEVIMINAPNIISLAMNAIRPFLSASTRDQMKIFGTNKREWLKYLDNKIDKSQRDYRYGGTL